MDTITVKRRVMMPIRAGDVMAEFISFQGDRSGKEHIGISFEGKTPSLASHVPLVRLHSECLTGDVFGSGRCDCGEQLDEAIDLINQEGGYILYLRQEGRGIGLYAKLEAYALQDKGFDTYQANDMLNLPEDGRDFHIAAQMLKALGVHKIRLLTNNPDKARQLIMYGIDITEQVPTKVHVNQYNHHYLKTKADRKCHTMTFDD
ncbi:MAG: GTP cyclohydrolase II [Oceanospirillaceae bacterium]|nr:GTP cyclohydrolase II [Oceanospirillaceae bacterium]